MKGMLRKDLLMMKNNAKFILVSFLIYVLYSILFKTDMSFFLPFMGFMTAMSTLSYDDYNNWHAYASSLPQGRVNVVKSKYITSLAIIFILAIVGVGVSLIFGKLSGELNIANSISSMLGVMLAIEFMMSVLYPVLFKYGAEKGRMAMIIMGIAIMGIALLFTNVIHIDVPENLINFVENYFVALFAGVSAVMVVISFLISKKIYLNREF